MAADERKMDRSESAEEGASAKGPDQSPAAALDGGADPGEHKPAGPPIVGIGASAGGLDAFKKFFAAMPDGSGLAFVLIPHLDPKHESLMVELIARHTPMPVVEAGEGMAVEPNHVYVLPPNKYMTITGGVLHLTGPVERFGSQTSIDLFLRSLADDRLERAICIIMSGTGAHGTLGLKAVKAAGGMAMVQDPATADYGRMPQSAVGTGLADYVLPVEQMPAALLKYVKHFYVNGGSVVEVVREAPDDLNQVLALLRARTKYDFHCYRKKMLVRRIERRMGLNHFGNLAEYLSHLRNHPDEVRRLARDLFISVTSFFRDGEAFEALESQVIDSLVRVKDSDAPLRVWIPGCATGEEAYSLAILLLERLAGAQKNCRLQVFATDVDEAALETARQGVYPDSIAPDVSPERLARHFTRADGTLYQVNKQVREPVVFAVQNLINDAPFSKLDLISCRNLLIYLEPEVQKKVVTLLHFALSEGGYLFLGPSETIGRQTDLFEPLSKKWRIYRRTGPTRLERVEFPISLQPEQPGRPRRLREAGRDRPVNLAELTQRLVVEELGLAAVLINREYEILYFLGPTTRYLDVPTGEPTQDLMMMAREGLRTKLRSAIRKALGEKETVVLTDVQVKRNGDYYPICATVRLVEQPRAAEGLILITFQDQTDTSAGAAPRPTPAPEESLVRQLESELRATKEDLQSTIEELESTNEELKVSNEEVMSMNEELQSANEELETSKEELQSLNEELTTVNNQLQDKVEDLETTTNDITNLLNCTDIATVFLDTQFHIRRFTPPSTRLFSLIATDVGRPLSDIAGKFADAELLAHAEQVLRDLRPIEKEIRTEDHWWLRRILPYRTLDNRIEGVVLTFSDVTELRRADLERRRSEQRFRIMADSAPVLIWICDTEKAYTWFNKPWLDFVGGSLEQELGDGWARNIHSDDLDLYQRTSRSAFEARGPFAIEYRLRRRDGVFRWVLDNGVPLSGDDDEFTGYIGSCIDITDRKQAETELKKREAELELVAKTTPMMLTRCGRDLTYRYVNAAVASFVGLTPDRVIGRPIREILGERAFATIQPHFERVLRGEPVEFEAEIPYPSGPRWTHVNYLPDRNERGEVVGWLASIIDVTDRNRMEQELRKLNESLELQVAERTQYLLDRENRLQGILNTALDAIVTIDRNGVILTVNPASERMFGYSADEMIGQNVDLLMPPPHRDQHDGYLARYLATRERHIIGVWRELQGRRKDGVVFPLELAVSEVEPWQRFTGIFRDLSQRKRLEREVLDIASLEQRRIGQDLHDSVGQELTALGMLVAELAETRNSDSPDHQALIDRLSRGLRNIQGELRIVLRGLLPVTIDREGLAPALADLADRTQRESKVICTFTCRETVAVVNEQIATHLFLIAQEAVHNALKHAQPKAIRITLKAGDRLVLSVRDDGSGLPERPSETRGLGLRVMHNRAAILGAELTMAPAKPTGTLIICTLGQEQR